MLWWICFCDTEAMQRGLSHFTSSPAGSRLHPPARDPCPLSGGCVWRTSPTQAHWKRETFKITKESAAGCMFVVQCPDILFFSTAPLDRHGATTPLKPSYHVCTSLTHSVPRGRVTYRLIDDLPFGDGGASHHLRSEVMAVITAGALF